VEEGDKLHSPRAPPRRPESHYLCPVEADPKTGRWSEVKATSSWPTHRPPPSFRQTSPGASLPTATIGVGMEPAMGASRVLTAAISSHLIHIAYSSVPGNPSASISCSVGQDSEPLIGTTGPTSTCLAGPPTHISTPSHSPFLATVIQRVPLGPQKISLITLCVSAHVECSGQAPSPRSGRLAPGYPGYCRQG
jgi:hypothetical protein